MPDTCYPFVLNSAHGNPLVTADRHGPNLTLHVGAMPGDPAEITPDEARELAGELIHIADHADGHPPTPYLRGLAAKRAELAELDRRVEDLRAFEREYRSRLIAYMENQLKDLREGR